jgi:hypothetical protein
MKPTNEELEILNAIAGKSPWPAWGAWVGAVLSSLCEDGLTTSETQPRLTDKGRAVLAAMGGTGHE